MSDHLGPHDRLSKEALKDLDGTVLPVVIGNGPNKRTIGVATMTVVDGCLHLAGEITDPIAAEFIKQDPAFFSTPTPKPASKQKDFLGPRSKFEKEHP